MFSRWKERFVNPVVLVLVLMVALLSVPTMGQEITLEVMHRWSGDRHPVLREVLDRFEEAHPGVTVVDYQVGSTLNEKLTAAWLGGSGPDIAMINLNSSTSFGVRGLVSPLSSFIAAEGDDFTSLMYPSMWDAATWEGEIYFLPMTMNVGRHLMYYNRDLFAMSGLDPDSPPATHSEWRNVARRLTRLDGQGGTIQRGIDLVTTTNSRNFDMAQALVEQWGTGFFDSGASTVLEDVPRAASVMDWMLDVHHHQGGELPSGGSDGRPFFQSETTAMYMGIDGDWFIFTESNPNMDLAMSTLPVPDGEPLRTIVVAGWGWGISHDTKHPEMAWELLKWLSVDPRGGGYFIQQQGRMSSNPWVNQDPLYLDIHPYWHVLGEVANASVPGPQRCVNITAGDATGLIGGALTQAARGEGDPLSALLEARRVLQPKCEEF